MNPVGYRVQTLGIQLNGDKQLGFSGAFETSTLWTNPVMHAKCMKREHDRTPDEFSDFEPELHGFQSVHASWHKNLVRPDTVKRKPKPQESAEDMRCRSHLYNAATGRASHCTCGIYAFKSVEDLYDQYHPDRFMYLSSELIMCVTEVIGWGAVAEYTLGWRMQNARPVGITLICNTDNQEEMTALWDDGRNDQIGRFIRPGRMTGTAVIAALPIHALVALMSAKFECTVRVAKYAYELLATPPVMD